MPPTPRRVTKPPRTETRNVRIRNSASARTGAGVRRRASRRRRAAAADDEAAPATVTRRASDRRALRARTRAAAMPDRTGGIPSSPSARRLRRGSQASSGAPARSRADPSGMLMKKITRQCSQCDDQTAEERAHERADQRRDHDVVHDRDHLGAGKVRTRASRPTGVIIAPPIPGAAGTPRAWAG